LDCCSAGERDCLVDLQGPDCVVIFEAY
jgi:hypothetical protein